MKKNKIINIISILYLFISWVLITQDLFNKYINIPLLFLGFYLIFNLKFENADYNDKKGYQIGILVVYVLLIVFIK